MSVHIVCESISHWTCTWTSLSRHLLLRCDKHTQKWVRLELLSSFALFQSKILWCSKKWHPSIAALLLFFAFIFSFTKKVFLVLQYPVVHRFSSRDKIGKKPWSFNMALSNSWVSFQRWILCGGSSKRTEQTKRKIEVWFCRETLWWRPRE